MSVDTSLRGKDTSRYARVDVEDVSVLVAPSMMRVAEPVRVAVTGVSFLRRFDATIEHVHGPACAHRQG